MAGFRRARWWVTAGVLAGMPSLFRFNFGHLQNVYGALLLTAGLFCLRRGNRWNKAGLTLSCITAACLLVASNEFLQGTYGLWAIGMLTSLTYAALFAAAYQAQLLNGRQPAVQLLKLGIALILATHTLYIAFCTWRPPGSLGVLPLSAQLFLLVLL